MLGCIRSKRAALLLRSKVLTNFRYEWPFLEHSYFYHLTRVDHRHNFSPYNTLLYLNSSPASESTLRLESLAFLPQLLLSAVFIPLALAKKDLASTMLAQTFAFVTFNKVCTSQVSFACCPGSEVHIAKEKKNPSQYFLWYLIFLPFYLPDSSLLRKPSLGLTALLLWVAGQVEASYL